MLNFREWKPQISQTAFAASFYTGPEALKKTLDSFNSAAAGASSEGLQFFNSLSEETEWVMPRQEVIRILVESFKAIRHVKSICAQFGSDGIIIWTLLEAYNRAARTRVHRKELEVCRLLRTYDFGFRVTSVDLVSPSELVGTGLLEIYSRP